MDPKSAKELPKRHSNRKRKVDIVENSPQETLTNVSSAENGNGKSIGDDNFPYEDFVDKHFITEKYHKEFAKWESEIFHVLLSAPIQSVALVRCLEQSFGDLKKKCKTYIEENAELKNKLSELFLQKSELVERVEGLMEENTKIKIKLNIKEDIVEKKELETKDLTAEIEELKAKIEESRDEIPMHHKAGFDKALKKVSVSISEIKP
ncbi:hypothetical protein MtrunA17_Chr1g0175811 [Medicago truncatula]|uniref:Uncharacterized protein n=1 Tax=Medicago truncatula TaxID=3880 RepID=A0A396JLZ9_MEDTR|nr:hypothetical protein MtrunA17_Chr1g0175811 [Medicago truncatula]